MILLWVSRVVKKEVLWDRGFGFLRPQFPRAHFDATTTTRHELTPRISETFFVNREGSCIDFPSLE